MTLSDQVLDALLKRQHLANTRRAWRELTRRAEQEEVGYLTYGTDAANMLFHVVNDRHRKRRAMIFTTNKAVSAWGRVLHDEDLAHAIVDRILERGRMLTLDGPSMRTKHLGLDDPTSSQASDQPARISGIQAPEFPEPTVVIDALISWTLAE